MKELTSFSPDFHEVFPIQENLGPFFLLPYQPPDLQCLKKCF